ncbi:MAG: hypothetical protein AAGA48_23825 [Myxococcota bacterium]
MWQRAFFLTAMSTILPSGALAASGQMDLEQLDPFNSTDDVLVIVGYAACVQNPGWLGGPPPGCSGITSDTGSLWFLPSGGRTVAACAINLNTGARFFYSGSLEYWAPPGGAFSINGTSGQVFMDNLNNLGPGSHQLEASLPGGDDFLGPHRGAPFTCVTAGLPSGSHTDLNILPFDDAFSFFVPNSAGRDVVFGTQGDDIIEAGEPRDLAIPASGAQGDLEMDFLCGFGGDDSLRGSSDNFLPDFECMWGGPGNDECFADFDRPSLPSGSHDRVDGCESTFPVGWLPATVDSICDYWVSQGQDGVTTLDLRTECDQSISPSLLDIVTLPNSGQGQ